MKSSERKFRISSSPVFWFLGRQTMPLSSSNALDYQQGYTLSVVSPKCCVLGSKTIISVFSYLRSTLSTSPSHFSDRSTSSPLSVDQLAISVMASGFHQDSSSSIMSALHGSYATTALNGAAFHQMPLNQPMLCKRCHHVGVDVKLLDCGCCLHAVCFHFLNSRAAALL